MLAGEQINCSVLMALNIGVEVTEIEEKGRSFPILDEGQSAVLNQASQLPLADAKIVSCLPRANEASVVVCWCGWKAHKRNPRIADVDNLALCKYVVNLYDIQISVLKQKGLYGART